MAIERTNVQYRRIETLLWADDDLLPKSRLLILNFAYSMCPRLLLKKQNHHSGGAMHALLPILQSEPLIFLKQ